MKCKWFDICPLREMEEKGEITKYYKKKYCLSDFKKCRRYQMEEKGLPHENMMPDGKNNYTFR